MINLKKLLGSSKKRSTKSSRTKKNSLNHRKKRVNKSHLKKYRNRPSPNSSATLYKVGTVKVGNDGQKYVVVSTKGKNKRTKRWIRKSGKNNKSIKRNKSNHTKRHMRGGSCKVSLGEESGFNVSDTHGGGGSLIKGLKLGSSRFEIGRSCNSSNSGHAMVV
jgi:hypothetical protein